MTEMGFPNVSAHKTIWDDCCMFIALHKWVEKYAITQWDKTNDKAKTIFYSVLNTTGLFCFSC